jgi:hypothetical protein
MNLDTATDEEIAEDIIAHPDCGSQLEANELAKRVMVRAQTPQWPGPDSISRFAVKVIATPNAHTNSMVTLAQAYESQRERIADLEDDVERLRPINPFVSEVLFRDDDSDMDIETSSCGGIDIVQRDHEGRAIETTITNAQGLELASALSEWAGLSVVDWRPICELKSGPVSALLLIPTDLGSDMECSHEGYLRNGAELQTFVQAASATHWAPLPKPPEAKS